MKTPKATLGRIVMFTVSHEAAVRLNHIGGGKHYTEGDECAGMIIKATESNICNLKLFPDADETIRVLNIEFAADGSPGTWAWPERVGGAGIEEAAA